MRFFLSICFIFSWVSFSLLKAQTLTPFKQVPIKNVQQCTTDRYKNIYITDNQGNIIQYSIQGDSLRAFSPQKIADISWIDAWQMVRVFVFYKDFQEYLFLNRFLTASERIKIDNELIGFARVATLASDNGIWAFDDTDFSLKKYNPPLKKLQINTPCDLLLNPQDYDISFIKEYQNQVFMADNLSGILVFDNLGNFKKKLYLEFSTNIGFWEDWIYFINSENQLYLQHIYIVESKKINLPIENHYQQVIYTTDTLVLLDESNMYFFKIQ